MVEESACNCLCFAEGTLDAISKKWTLLIINALGNHETSRHSSGTMQTRISSKRSNSADTPPSSIPLDKGWKTAQKSDTSLIAMGANQGQCVQ
jgi:hypothetical protein